VTEPQPIPINALFGMDFVTLLVVVSSADTMVEVSQKVAANVIGKRIAPRNAELAVYYRDRVIPKDWTVERAGIRPLQFVFVDYIDD
jgi:hypothetical protein